MLKLIRDIMIKKGITVTPFQSVDYAIQKMQRHKIGGLPVVKNRKLVGIITSRDVRDQNPNRLVCDVMTKEVIAGREDMTILEVLILMRKNKIERLPIVDSIHNKLVGLITKRDILSKLNDKEFSLVEQLIEETEDKILNPLSVISGATHLLEKELRPKNAKREYVEKIYNGVEKINKEVRMLRSFYTKTHLEQS